MANTKITELTQLTNPVSTDVLPIVDVGADVTKKISIADLLKNAAVGTAAAPSIAFDGDSNTGIYSPGADQVAISTNGTGRLFVAADGSVGIGHTPTAIFSVLGNARVQTSASGSVGYEIYNGTRNTGISSDFANSITFIDHNQTLVFRDSQNGYAERMRLDSSGRLGLGTSTVEAGHILQANGIIATVTPSGAFSALQTAGGTGFRWTLANNGTYQLQRTTDGFSTVTTPIYVDSSSRVGIGTASVSANLHIGDANGKLRIGIDTSSQYLDVYRDTATGFIVYNAAQSGAFRAHVWQLGGTEAARIDSSGRLLVGTSTSTTVDSGAAAKVQTDGYYAAAFLNKTADSFGPYVYFAKSRGGTTIVQNGDTLGGIAFNGCDGTDFETFGASIAAQVDGTPGANDMPGRLVFSTTADGASSPTERMKITSAGSAQFAAATTGIVSGSVSGAGTTFTTFIGQHSTASGPGTGTNSFLVYTNGDVQNTNNSYGALSDLKLKENIVDALSQWDDIKALQVRKYNFKEGQTHTQIGLVAQEVELVSPGLVTESPDRDAEGNDLGTTTKSVNYSVLYMKAVKALQEAMERIETLEAKVAALEGV